MRIAVVGLTHPFRGGISHYTTLLVRALGQRHEATLFALRKQYPGFLFPGRTQIDESTTQVSAPAHRLLVPWLPWTWLKTGLAIRRYAPDACIFEYWHPFFAPAYGSVARMLPDECMRIWELHNVLPHEPTLATRLLASFGFSSADAFLVHARTEEQRLQQMLPGARVAVVHHASYLELSGKGPSKAEARARLGIDEGERILLFFGYVRAYKGLDVLIEAMTRIHRETGARLLVRGEFYEDFAAYQARVRRLGLDAAVDMEDRFVSNEEIPVLLAASDLVVLPYREGTASGVVQLALGAGRPVVVTRVGGVAEAIEEGETGFVAEWPTPDCVADAVARYFATETDRPEMERAARVAAEQRFGWERTVQAIEDLVLAGSPRH